MSDCTCANCYCGTSNVYSSINTQYRRDIRSPEVLGEKLKLLKEKFPDLPVSEIADLLQEI